MDSDHFIVRDFIVCYVVEAKRRLESGDADAIVVIGYFIAVNDIVVGPTSP